MRACSPGPLREIRHLETLLERRFLDKLAFLLTLEKFGFAVDDFVSVRACSVNEFQQLSTSGLQRIQYESFSNF